MRRLHLACIIISLAAQLLERRDVGRSHGTPGMGKLCGQEETCVRKFAIDLRMKDKQGIKRTYENNMFIFQCATAIPHLLILASRSSLCC